MVKVNIVSDHRGLQGSFLNLIDFQQYLRDVENIDVVFHCNEISKLKEVINKTFRQYDFDEVKKIKDMILSTRCPVITDFKSLVTMYKDRKRIVAGKLIVFDSLELSLFLNDMKNAYFYPDITMDELLDWHKYSEILFLMPKCNLKILNTKYPHIPSIEFYKKIYIDKLKEIPVSDNSRLFYRLNNFYDMPSITEKDISKDIQLNYPNSVGIKSDQSHTLFQYKGYIYTKKQETNYFEQFGRLIFEFLILGKEVHWFDEPFEYNDGLRDYLFHYGDDGKVIKEIMQEPYKEKFWK